MELTNTELDLQRAQRHFADANLDYNKAQQDALSDALSDAEDALPEGFRTDEEHSLEECIQRMAAVLARSLKDNRRLRKKLLAEPYQETKAERQMWDSHNKSVDANRNVDGANFGTPG